MLRVFYLDVTYVLHIYCSGYTHMIQVYVLNVSAISQRQVFHVLKRILLGGTQSHATRICGLGTWISACGCHTEQARQSSRVR
jgi:hypothetical protein